jgi:hypothetical protein
VTRHEGPYGYETSRMSHFVDNRLTNGVEVVSLTFLSATLYPEVNVWYLFLLEAESTTGPLFGRRNYVLNTVEYKLTKSVL